LYSQISLKEINSPVKNTGQKASKVIVGNIYGKPSQHANVSKNYSSKYLHPTQQNLLSAMNTQTEMGGV
jgi:hypothetical protein